MIQKVTLPKLGESVEQATLERWIKQEGDAVTPGEILCEITTDKATLEVESTHKGTLVMIVARRGQEVPVGALIAVVGDLGEAIPREILAEAGCEAAAEAPARATASTAAEAVAVAAGEGAVVDTTVAGVAGGAGAAMMAGGRVAASPRARHRAAELGVALGRLKGSGPHGRIVEVDVESVARAATAVKASPAARKMAARRGVNLAAIEGTGHRGKVMMEDVCRAAAVPATVESAASGAAGDVVPLTPMRRVIAQRMLQSKQSVPCYYLEMDADVTDLVALRTKLNVKAASGKLTFNDFILKACAAALRAFPVVNSRWIEGQGIERRREVAIGFAVSLDDGLIVPVVREADRKSLREISTASADLTERARTKRLRPEEFQGGSMTVSNLGMYGVRSFIPVTNPGESSILGLGMIADRVVLRQESIQVRKVMAMTLAVDHRLVDGAHGAQFLEAIRTALEAPQSLVG